MKREYRNISGGEIRSIDHDAKTFTAKVLSYDTTDTYGTQFRTGCFSKSIDEKMPRSTWAHDWTRPIGKVIAVRDTGDGLEADFQLADFDAVPDARMAYSLIKDGIIDGFSVGFEPTDVRDAKGRVSNSQRMQAGDVCYEGNLVEISPVLVPSVPGTKTIAVRTDEPEVSKELVADLLVRFSRGDIDLADALTTIKTEGRAQSKSAVPHAYSATNGDGSICADCGGLPDAKVHANGRSKAHKRALGLAPEPTSPDSDPGAIAQAADATLDAALLLLNGVDLSYDPVAGQFAALVQAADLAIDELLDLWGLVDADDADMPDDGDEPDPDTDAAQLLQACDASIDAALASVAGITYMGPIGQAIALTQAADVAMDALMDATGIFDADEDVSTDDTLSYSAEDDSEVTAALALINRRIA